MNTLHPAVVAEMADRKMRLAHLGWHGIRETWRKLSEVQKTELRRLFRHFGWDDPRPSMDEQGNLIRGQGAGLDFLYMHRHMIEMVNGILTSHGAVPLEGWKEPPRVRDPNYPVPTGLGYTQAEFPTKNDEHWACCLCDARRFDDQSYLRGITLDLLGTEIEYGIHAAMHTRFGAFCEIGYRPSSAGGVIIVDPKWDDPAYDSLFDPYSSHVHPWFWKIHGWVDSRITAWEQANGKHAIWQNVWMGPMHHVHAHGAAHGAHLLDALEGQAGILLATDPLSGVFMPRVFPYSRVLVE
ncbi:hypothetical protein RAS2_07260 [Phycisphaerae bacterium RAS2]|nr:hypothetical protein RAS2_07260 [Phycisphaerae bacterium RAS2]